MSIYFLAPDLTHPSGGVRVLYRHADLLNAAGMDAAIVHQKPGFRVAWFANRTRVIHPPLEIGPEDILVFPEIEGPAIAQAAPGVRKVIFNQNAYYTFRGYPFAQGELRPPYRHPDVLGTIVVSEDSHRYLEHAFPGLNVRRVRLGIDPALYHPREAKERQICFVAHKHQEDAQQIISILRCRDALAGFRIVPIHNRPAEEAAAILRQSMVFLSVGYPEGFGLPAAEAMACGCVVIGYHGNGGREFFTPEYGFPIEVGDIIGFAMAAEQVLRTLDRDPHAYADMTRRASQFIHSTYSVENERIDIISVWRQILNLS